MCLMKFSVRFSVLILQAGVLLTACQPAPEQIRTPTAITAPQLTPYPLSTATPSSTPGVEISTPSSAQLPSPTPFTHTIQAGDTLFGIALQYNISLDRLVAANPGLNSSLLTIGTEVIIPAGEDGAVLAVPSPTPFPLEIRQNSCLPGTEGGLWCFVIVYNDHSTTLENLTVQIGLYSAEGELVNSTFAVSPLNYLPPDQAFPLQGYFPPPLPDDYQTAVKLVTSLPSDQPPPRLEMEEPAIEYRSNQRSAEISGTIQLPADLEDYQSVWIAAVGYQDNQVIGLRKWVSDSALTPGANLAYQLQLYSLGPALEEVRVFAELH